MTYTYALLVKPVSLVNGWLKTADGDRLLDHIRGQQVIIPTTSDTYLPPSLASSDTQIASHTAKM